MPQTVTLRMEEKNYRLISRRARAERRSLSNYIETAALEYARESEFADDWEMEEIRSNERLLRRLRQGSREAKERKGRFVV